MESDLRLSAPVNRAQSPHLMKVVLARQFALAREMSRWGARRGTHCVYVVRPACLCFCHHHRQLWGSFRTLAELEGSTDGADPSPEHAVKSSQSSGLRHSHRACQPTCRGMSQNDYFTLTRFGAAIATESSVILGSPWGRILLLLPLLQSLP